MKVLIVDADTDFGDHLARQLAKRGVEVFRARREDEVRDTACREKVHAVLLGLYGRDRALLSILRAVKAACPQSQFILINHAADVPLSIEAMKLGAFDEIAAPVDMEELLVKLHSARSAAEQGGGEADAWSQPKQEGEV
ncbi:response regulator [Pseudodesulfovibrio tunisiensis]|uniref:response regulator n=1 Tax=Pseudodesulfovibrio tunisiensis TaxID=463192 RepID=UPI001FB45D5F|nr:response regulator [Pseudodesulfovibrio tunisiensis]